MIQLFKSLFGDNPRERQAKGRAPKLSARPSHVTGDYRAVSLAPSLECYAAAKNAAGSKRYLLREAPRLPLINCATPANCSCKFRKHADRRDGDRRLLGEIETDRWFAGSERRMRAGRRSKTN